MTDATLIIGAFLAGMGVTFVLFGLLDLSSSIRVDDCGNVGEED